MEEFQLDILPGDFGLPSLDRECLLALTYCRFSGIAVRVQHQTNLWRSKVPALHIRGETITGAEAIIAYFERKNLRPNGDHSAGDSGRSNSKLDLWSYKTLINKKLEPCLQYFWWYDVDNYNHFLSGWYAGQLPFPTNFFVPNQMRKASMAKLEAQFSTKVLESESKTKTIEDSVTNEARYCLNLLIEKLANQSYFFGTTPGSLDALVFSYLALLVKVPVRNQVIQSHVKVSESLVKFVDRVLVTYLGKDLLDGGSGAQSPFDDANKTDATIPWKDVMFSGAVTAFLMLFYAVSTGLVNLSDSEPKDNNYDDEEASLADDRHEHDHHH